MTIQELNLKVGEKASCTAGYPSKGTVVVECIKDFGNPTVWNAQWDDIINNPYDYVKIVDNGLHGALTSHWISGSWNKITSKS